jgi:hypothetical protein
MFYPSPKVPGRADQVWTVFTRGLRRVRPGLIVNYDMIHTSGPMLTIFGEPVEGLEGLLLEPFCTKPLPELQVTHLRGRTQYTLSGDEVGVQSAVDLVHVTLLEGKRELHRASGEAPRKTTMAVGFATPSRIGIFDVPLHDDVYPGQQPTLHLYRAIPGSVSDPNDPGRDVDRLDMIESIQPLGRGVAKFRSAENPVYLDMLKYICEQRRLDPGALRGFRCQIKFPVFSSELMMAFDLPPSA